MPIWSRFFSGMRIAGLRTLMARRSGVIIFSISLPVAAESSRLAGALFHSERGMHSCSRPRRQLIMRPPGKLPGRITGWESRGFVLLSMFSRFWIFRRSDIFCEVSMCRKLPGRLRGCPVCPAQTLPTILWRDWPWMRFSSVWPQNCPECAVPDIHHHLPHERGHILRRDILKSFQSARWRITSEYIRIICHAHFKMNINAHPSSF